MSAKSKRILSIIALLVMGMLLVFVGSQDSIHSRQLATCGETVIGKVLDGEDDIVGRCEPKNGGVLSPHGKLSRDVYQLAQIRCTEKVHCPLANPTISQADEPAEA